MERVTGIEPALSAWEADVLPLNYTRVTPLTERGSEHSRHTRLCRRADTVRPVLLSDRDIHRELKSGRVVLDPFDPAMVQPSSDDGTPRKQ